MNEEELKNKVEKLRKQEAQYNEDLANGKSVPLKGTMELDRLEAQLKGIQQGKEQMKNEIVEVIKKCKTKAEAPCKISEHSCMDYEDCTDCICDYLIKKIQEIK